MLAPVELEKSISSANSVTSFFISEILKLLLQVKFFFLIRSPLTVISRPLFTVLPRLVDTDAPTIPVE